jgi:hypothetical protein
MRSGRGGSTSRRHQAVLGAVSFVAVASARKLAHASTLDAQGHLVFDSDAVFTSGFESPALFNSLATRRVQISFWGFSMGAEPELDVLYPGAGAPFGPYAYARIVAIRTGRETSDGWAEYSTTDSPRTRGSTRGRPHVCVGARRRQHKCHDGLAPLLGPIHRFGIRLAARRRRGEHRYGGPRVRRRHHDRRAPRHMGRRGSDVALRSEPRGVREWRLVGPRSLRMDGGSTRPPSRRLRPRE